MSIMAQAQAKADELARQAAGHKSAVRFHRRQLAERMRALEDLQAACARAGIRITINAKPPQRRHGAPTNSSSSSPIAGE